MSKIGLELSLMSPLDDFDLNVQAQFTQAATGIFGVSGAGKTTILKCIAGLKKDVTGHVRFNGQDWLNSTEKTFLGPEHRRIGYVPQNGLLFPNKNVRENLLVASPRRSRTNGAISLESVCELLELGGLLERSTHRLSGGERQRVALGRALFSDPQLLLLDEPLAALDLKLKRQILPFLQRVREELNIPMVMISHYPSEIQALCDEVLVIGQGKKIAFGSTQEVLYAQEVLQLTHGEGYENLLPTIVMKPHSCSTNTGEISNDVFPILHVASEQRLITAKKNAVAGSKLWVGIPANDIIIATQRPHGISAQNVIKVRVTKIEPVADTYMICTAVNDLITLNAEISRQSLHNLNIQLDDTVFLIIKSGSCILYSH